jgi:hypothetical protein
MDSVQTKGGEEREIEGRRGEERVLLFNTKFSTISTPHLSPVRFPAITGSTNPKDV